MVKGAMPTQVPVSRYCDLGPHTAGSFVDREDFYGRHHADASYFVRFAYPNKVFTRKSG
jgi:hypothetical protein